MTNRLARETSPYLQQHAHNPVDWYAWGEEALARARAEDKPILLSVGYSACHWCHVMAHESFEDPAVAQVMNQHYVNIKVDREERPDLDQIYQTAHQMLAQRGGGWPLTMFLSPDGTPFWGGTYFPKSARYGLPGFVEILERIAAVWREQRAAIGEQGEQLRLAFARLQPRPARGGTALDAEPVHAALEALRASFDPRHGGFGGAPKFPHPTDLELCLRQGETGIAATTLLHMCEGGIYDQLGGGFCRYSVDAQWSVPHFEKMLYDNGPLLALLADAWLVTGNAAFARCAGDTAGWILREMQSAAGGYFSSLDADSEHEEGKYYVWDAGEVRALLTREEWEVVAPHYGLDGAPNFEERHWHLRVARPLRVGGEPLLASARAKLLAAREQRVRPGRDEKVLVSWNALAMRGMAHAGRVFGRQDWIDSARRALDFVRGHMWSGGRLFATFKDGRAHLNAYLDDYAFLIAALLELLQAKFRAEDLEFAEALAEVLLDQYEDREAGGFYFTASEHERLIHRPKSGHDNAMASGNGVAAWALNRLAAITGEQRYAQAAERALTLFCPSMREHPQGFAMLVIALQEQLEPPATAIVRGAESVLATWIQAMGREYLPGTMVLAVPEGLRDLPPVLDKPASVAVNAWLCRGVTCLPPIDSVDALKKACKDDSLR
ncbi:MAG TPA: thioredoxin domain-containing protein [Burkholderiales bacterium]